MTNNDWRAEDEKQAEKWVTENLTPAQIDHYLDEVIQAHEWLSTVPGYDPSANYLFSDICVRYEYALECANPWIG